MENFHAISVDQNNKILNITLSRGDAGNPIDELVLDELSSVLNNLDDNIRVLVLSGSGNNFSIGGNKSEFLSDNNEQFASDMNRMAKKARNVCEALSTSDAVTIAKVHGSVVGAGLALALFCDLRVGTYDSSFRLPELALGVPTAWGGTLSRLLSEIGAARTRELFLTGRKFGAEEAANFNILQYISPESEIDQMVSAISRPLLRRSQEALRITKSMLNAHSANSKMGDITWLEGSLMTASGFK